MEQHDEEDGLPEKLLQKSAPYHKEREHPPRFAQPGTFEFEYSSRWKALDDMERQQREQVDRNIRDAKEKLEQEMETAKHEHQLMMMRQDLMRRQEELRRLEELRNAELQKRKAIEMSSTIADTAVKSPVEKKAKPTAEPPCAFSTPCIFCQGKQHAMEKCNEMKMSLHKEKIDFLKRNGLCYRCLKHGHLATACKEKIKCQVCHLFHPTVLHVFTPQYCDTGTQRIKR